MNVENGGKIFVQNASGAFHELGEIAEITATAVEELSETARKAWRFTESQELSFEVSNVSKNHWNMIIGRKRMCPNNWLKHHGLPMNRKNYKRTPSSIKYIRREVRRMKKHGRKRTDEEIS